MKTNLPALGRFTCAVLLSAAAVWSARADYPSIILTHSPLGYWRFDETVISPPLNKITNATALGSIADGFCVADATKGQPGIVGNSVRFNNPGNVVGFCGSKIDVPYNAALNPNPPFSIEFWTKPNSLGSDTSFGFCPLENLDPNFSSGSRAGWIFYLNNTGTWQFRLGNRNGYAGLLTATSGNAVAGVWQHIVATWDGTNANLYANGVNIGSAAISATNWLDNAQSFLRFGGTPLTGNNAETPAISATSNNGNRGYDGWLEEVAIYPKVLSPSNIFAHDNAATTNNAGYTAQILADNPAGYWPMNDSAYTAPNPGTYPVATNSGSLGSAADGTNMVGTVAGQNGPGYAGFGAGDKAVFFDGDNGYFQVKNAPRPSLHRQDHHGRLGQANGAGLFP